jgi:hypothetical protein
MIDFIYKIPSISTQHTSHEHEVTCHEAIDAQYTGFIAFSCSRLPKLITHLFIVCLCIKTCICLVGLVLVIARP